MAYTSLDNIKSPKDIKKFDKQELRKLAVDIRKKIIKIVSTNGGHLASNLGVVELTIALHRVFDSPKDAIVWDVGHQCYTHKILTGRANSFDSIRIKDGLSGFPKKSESPHDFFDTGHSSTSISSALGLLNARKLSSKSGKVIAVIGDGALTGGMAIEALAHAGQLLNDLIVVVNDNDMSISKNIGGISLHLSKLTATYHYQHFKYYFDKLVSKIPFIGKPFTSLILRVKRGLKGLFYGNNIFVDLGFEYVGPLDGHNETELEDVFKRVKMLNRPVVIHVKTKKGKGFSLAENDPALFHGIGPFNLSDGKVEKLDIPSFTAAFSQAMLDIGEKNKKVVAITAAMSKGTGLSTFQHRFPNRFFDVGIAEQHAVTFAGGLASGGMRPVVAIYSTFIQRAIDQIIHDVSLQKVPVVFALDRSGPVPCDGETHQGIFDIALIKPIPYLDIISPASVKEVKLALEYALKQNHGVVIRYPKAPCPKEEKVFSSKFEIGRGVFPHKDDKDVLVVCTSGMYSEVLEASHILGQTNQAFDIFTLRFIKPFDIDWFLQQIKNYKIILFVEDGLELGGISRDIEKSVNSKFSKIKTAVKAFPQDYFPQGSRSQILNSINMDSEAIAKSIRLLMGVK